MEVIETLGYSPNNAARALRSRRTRICGAVIPTLNHAIYAHETNALEERLSKSGYSLLVTTSEYDPIREFNQAKLLVERGAEGIVLVGDAHDPRLYDFLRARNVPFINTYVFNPHSKHPCAGFDNRRAAVQIIEFLIRLGHTDIGVIAGVSKDNDRVLERLEGIRSALQMRNLVLSSDRLVEKPYNIDDGYEAMRTLAGKGGPPTAVVCFSDILAIGALAYCADLCLDVPDEVSIVGFDNLDYGAYLRPALTTLEIPATKMGHLAANFLVQRLLGQNPPEFYELDTRLIVRSTTRQLADGSSSKK
jgi:LacI family transcriptional regulator, galactose operon repressor